MASCGNVEQRPEGDESEDGKDDQRSLGKPVIWAGMFIPCKLYPVIWMIYAASVIQE